MAPWRHELQKETHPGVLRARRSISLYNLCQRFAHSGEGAAFLLLDTDLFPRFISLTLDFQLHLCTLCWAAFGLEESFPCPFTRRK